MSEGMNEAGGYYGSATYERQLLEWEAEMDIAGPPSQADYYREAGYDILDNEGWDEPC